MEQDEVEKIELDLFLDALYRRYGYDFRHYAKASVQRRAKHILANLRTEQLSDLIPLLLHDEAFANTAIYDFSITVTEVSATRIFTALCGSRWCPT